MRHIECDITAYLDSHKNIKKYVFKLPFPVTITDTNMFSEPIRANHVVLGINSMGIIDSVTNNGDQYDLMLYQFDTEDLHYLLNILEKGEFKS
jgi:hypothetical protein